MARSAGIARLWGRPVRVLVTLWLFWHFTALVVAATAAPPSAQVVRDLWEVFRPYLELLHLNHAYRFYSPEPGPTMVMRYRITLPDGQVHEDLFPKRSDYGPRLRYQRRLALTNALVGPKLIPGSDQPDRALLLAESYARYLARSRGATSVELERVLHRPLPIEAARRGTHPADPRFYSPPDRLGLLESGGGQLVWHPDRSAPPSPKRPPSTQDERQTSRTPLPVAPRPGL